ncbi:MAG TPA: hypothetical protein VFE15_06325 [Marmoricola sp.]|jgi:hypothetical protein|nr:hypothetical protein [Marmoricola sp.]
MDKMLMRILVTFTVGFLVIGGVLAFQKVGDCGSVFNSSGGCPGAALAGHVSLVIVFLGLGLTGLVATIMVDQVATKERLAAEKNQAAAPHQGPDDLL